MKIVKTFAIYAFFLYFWLWLVPIQILGQKPFIAADPVPMLLGGALIVVGLMVTFTCMLGFALQGKGTPLLFDPPRNLVTGVMYSHVRNPMYVGFIILILGEAAVFRSPAILAVCAGYWLVTHILVVLVEEPTLKRRFGESYAKYLATVPRWLPKLR